MASCPTSWRRSAWPSATRSIAGQSVDVKPGNAMPLGSMPVGTIVHNIETKPGKGGSLARAAGTYAMVAGRDQGYVLLKLKSGETRMVDAACMASVGAVSNPDHINEVIGKAGRQRWKGYRPVSRGIARNPVDHPNGGRTNGGKHWATPWGKPTKGKKTRKNKSDAEVHRAQPPRSQEVAVRGSTWHVQCGKARSSTGIS